MRKTVVVLSVFVWSVYENWELQQRCMTEASEKWDLTSLD